MKSGQSNRLTTVFFGARGLALVVSVSLVLVASSCNRDQRLFADCDYALRLQNVALAINSPDEIDPAFKSLGMNRPISIRTVGEAQEYLLNASAKIGCEDKVHSSYLLGILYLRQERYSDAVRVLQYSVRTHPTVDGLQALAEAYDKLGKHGLAEAMRSKAKSLTVE